MSLDPSAASGSDVMRQFVPSSPFVVHLGIELVALGDGTAELRLPYRPELATLGTTVHGGAIATLIDTAAMAAAWAGVPVPGKLRGSTVALHVAYLAPAVEAELVAHAAVLRRGRSLAAVDVTVTAAGEQVARGTVTYKVG